MTSLTGRSVLVAGASGELGRRISCRLAAAGAHLTITGRDQGRLDSLGLDAVVVTGDLRRAETAREAVKAAVDRYDRLDGLIIASGVVAFGAVETLPDAALVDLFRTNTIAPIRLIQTALPYLSTSARQERGPFVVNISAVVAEQPTAGMAAYSASKAALTAYDAAAGRELRRVGIRLIDARPPHTDTGLADRPIAGTAPRLPAGLDPAAVVERVLTAIEGDERDLPSAAFL